MTERRRSRVFVSYRREDAAGHVNSLGRALIDRLGSDGVFVDMLGVPPAADFVRVLERELASSAVLLAVVGPRWLTASTDEGRRLESEGDYVRYEVRTALRSPGVTVLPVLVSGARMPIEADLPEDIRTLARCQALELRDGKAWKADLDDLLRFVERLPGVTTFHKARSTAFAGVAAALVVATVMLGARILAPLLMPSLSVAALLVAVAGVVMGR